MRWRITSAAIALGVIAVAAAAIDPPASQPADPAADFIRQVDNAPPDKRPPQWDEVKRRMARKAPAVGEPAPDFSLKTPEGETEIVRSRFHVNRPCVLIFGSFT